MRSRNKPSRDTVYMYTHTSHMNHVLWKRFQEVVSHKPCIYHISQWWLSWFDFLLRRQPLYWFYSYDVFCQDEERQRTGSGECVCHKRLLNYNTSFRNTTTAQWYIQKWKWKQFCPLSSEFLDKTSLPPSPPKLQVYIYMFGQNHYCRSVLVIGWL